jgi:hypothetical protein
MSRALWMASGVIAWALHFALIYGFTGLACARGWDRAVPWTVGIATLAAAGIAAFLLVAGLQRRRGFEGSVTAGLAAFALLAILWEGAAIFMVPPCALR